MNKLYVIRVQEVYSDGKVHSYLRGPAFTKYQTAYEHLEGIIEDDKNYYLDGGWEEQDLDRRLIWNKDPDETWVKWNFFDEYTMYYIEELEVK